MKSPPTLPPPVPLPIVTRPPADSDPPLTCRRTPAVTPTFTVPVPVLSEDPGSSRSVPPLTLIAPVSVLTRSRTSGPGPILVSPAVPASGAASRAAASAPSALTVRVGAPARRQRQRVAGIAAVVRRSSCRSSRDRCRRRRGCRSSAASRGARCCRRRARCVLNVGRVAGAAADDPVLPVRVVAPQAAAQCAQPRAVADQQAREDLSGGEAAAQHVAGGVRDAGAGRVHVEPHRALTRERTDGDVDGACPSGAETPEIAPVRPPPNVGVKSDASTPLTGSLNVTRNMMASALPDAAVGFRRLTDTTAGADRVDDDRRTPRDDGLEPPAIVAVAAERVAAVGERRARVVEASTTRRRPRRRSR